MTQQEVSVLTINVDYDPDYYADCEVDETDVDNDEIVIEREEC